MPIILGLTGRCQAGKTTCADYLQQRYGFRQESFANPARRSVAQILNITWERLAAQEDNWLAEFNATPRQMITRLHHDWGHQQIHPALWVQALLRRTDNLRQDYVITEVVYPQERALIRQRGVLVHIRRPLWGSWRADPELNPQDKVLDNHRSVGHLQQQLDLLVLTVGLEAHIARLRATAETTPVYQTAIQELTALLARVQTPP